MRRARLTVLSVMAASSLLANGRAAAQPNPSTEDERECWRIASAQAEAWNAGDAKAFALDFVEDGEFIGSDGKVAIGRDEIAKLLAERVRTVPRDRRLWITLRSMRELGPSGMIVDTDQEVSGAGEVARPGNTPERMVEHRLRVRYVLVREGGRWWIAGQQETKQISPRDEELSCGRLRHQGTPAGLAVPVRRISEDVRTDKLSRG